MCDQDLRECLQINMKNTQTSINNSTVNNDSGYRSTNVSSVSASTHPSRSFGSSMNSTTNLFTSQSQVLREKPNTSNQNRQFQNRNSSFNNTNNMNTSANNSENAYVCYCNVAAAQFTVRKEGPNQGRQFYSCSTKACQFFLWADADATTGGYSGNGGGGGGGFGGGFGGGSMNDNSSSYRSQNRSSFNGGGGGGGGVQCSCGKPATL